jgi:hypothetical protein
MSDKIVSILEQRRQALLERASKTKDIAERMIWVTFRKEGIHQYPAASTDPGLADVNFLGYPHRHIFHFTVWITVWHNDRDLEFIQFKRWLESLYGDGILDLNNQSCEMMSDALYDKITERYPDRNIWIEVSEDGENGCLIKYKLPEAPVNQPKYR